MIKIYESVTIRNNMCLRLKYGQATVKFDFERGNVGKGIHARYITNDPFKQRVLDNSEHLGNLYRLVKSIPESGDDTTAINKEKELLTKAQQAAKAAYDAVMNGEAVTDTSKAQSGGEESQSQSETSEDASAATQSKGTPMKDVTFSDASEAIIYVMEHWGEQVESLEAATKVLRKHKINPVIK